MSQLSITILQGARRAVSRVRPASFRCACILLLSSCQLVCAEGHYITTPDGVRIFYETRGCGTPIFVIAGGPGADPSVLRPTLSLLRSLGRVVFVHNRGRGKSDALFDHPESFTLENDVMDVEAIRKALGAERIVVLGHSYGSMVAASYAVKHPRNTIALITVGAIHGAKSWQKRNIDVVKSFLMKHYPNVWKKIVEAHQAGRLTSDPFYDPLFRSADALYGDQDPIGHWRVARQFPEINDKASSRPSSRHVYKAMVGDDPEWKISGSLKDVELLPQLKTYDGPALIIGGRHDRLAPPVQQFEIADALANGKLVILEHSGHNPYRDVPLQFIDVVYEFLIPILSSDESCR